MTDDDLDHHDDADVQPAVDPSPEAERKRRRRRILELPGLILLAFAIALIVKTFALQAFYIPSGSMEPGLQINDRVLVNKLVYRLHEPRRGDIIVFARDEDRARKSLLQRVRGILFEGLGVTRPGHTDFIKRVIGLPGETVEIIDGTVYITPLDAERFPLDEPYAVSEPEDDFGPYVVPADSLFVLGDNRPNSGDSRSELGPIERDDVIGRAFLRIWPPSRLDVLRRARYPQGNAAGTAMLLPR
jgi:signal peptidase I